MWHLKLDEMMMPLTLYTKFDCATQMTVLNNR